MRGSRLVCARRAPIDCVIMNSSANGMGTTWDIIVYCAVNLLNHYNHSHIPRHSPVTILNTCRYKEIKPAMSEEKSQSYLDNDRNRNRMIKVTMFHIAWTIAAHKSVLENIRFTVG